MEIQFKLNIMSRSGLHMSFFGFFSGKNKSPHQLLGEGKLKPALEGFLQMHQTKPDEPIFMVQIAEIYVKLGKPEKALPYYIQVGNHFLNRGFVNKAVASFKKALNISPDNDEVIGKLGELNEEASRFMLNDSFFQRQSDSGSGDFEEDFDITQEEISIAEESLRLDLEQASSEVKNLTLSTLPDFGFDGVAEQIKQAAASSDHETDPGEIAPEQDEDSGATPDENNASVFKKRTVPEKTQTEPREGESFSTLDEALDAAFSFTVAPQEKNGEKPAMLNDPERWTLFKGMDRDTFIDIVKALESRCFEAGEYIIRQGDEGSEMYLIVEGEVEVYIHSDELSKKVAILKSGEFFGEGAILTKSKRNADLRALIDTEVLALSKKDFISLVKKHPQILSNMKLPFHTREKINKKILGEKS